MTFLHPEFLLLGLPLALVMVRWAHPCRAVQVLRAAVAVGLLLALAAPVREVEEPGRDLIFLVDRSDSMDPLFGQQVLEWIRLAEEGRGEGDRIGVVTVGAEARLEQAPREEGAFPDFAPGLDGSGTELAEGIDLALAQWPEDRGGRLLLCSDGLSEGSKLLAAARRARHRGIAVDTVPSERALGVDLAVDRLDLPQEVDVGEPLQINAWVLASAPRTRGYALYRGGELIARGSRTFHGGANRVVFRDRLEGAGVQTYSFVLDADPDARPENDRGLGAVRVNTRGGVLIVQDSEEEGPLATVLRKAGFDVEVSRPESAPLDRIGLTAYAAVILDNIQASRIRGGTRALRDFVLEGGGGLMMTGGERSLGLGGYHLSPLEQALPVTLEIRDESRKNALALVAALDRSGSMGAGVSGGRTKMDLANEGAASAVSLLGPNDGIAVLAVDTGPQAIVAMQAVERPEALRSKILRIRSGGGGIYVHAALEGALEQLRDVPQKERHVVLFADAADSQDQQGVPELIERMRGEFGITISVIALGTIQDPDALFLESVAREGAGGIYFTTEAEELPRLFAQDTLISTRSTFLEGDFELDAKPALVGLGDLEVDGLPSIGGYNLCWLRNAAQEGVGTLDEHRAPILSFAQRGLGRSVVYAGELGGEHGGAFVAWPGFPSFMATITRWLEGDEGERAIFTDVEREGDRVVVRVEWDPELRPQGGLPRVLVDLPDGSEEEVPLRRTGAFGFEGSFAPVDPGVYLGRVRFPDGAQEPMPAFAISSSPEHAFETDPGRGRRNLERTAEISGGESLTVVGSLFGEVDVHRVARPWTRVLAIFALVLAVIEIAVRRLGLFDGVWRPKPAPGIRGAAAVEARVDARDPEGARVPEDDGGGGGRHGDLPAIGSGDPMADALGRARRGAQSRLGGGARD